MITDGASFAGTDDSARSDGDIIVASDAAVTSALAARPSFTRTSNGYSGSSDGPAQLMKNFTLEAYPRAGQGNVVQTGQLAADGVTSRHAELALGFGETAAQTARASLKTGFPLARQVNETGWREYLRGLKQPPASMASDRDLYQASMLMLAASEDKQNYRGPDGQASPWSQQERWEEQGGYSPSTIASVIAGLVCAAELARHNNAPEDAKRYLAVADGFKAKLPGWTVSTNGPLPKDPYFVRLTKDGNANAGTTYNLGHSSVTSDQRAIADAGFLELVRLGIYPPDDPVIRNSIEVTDTAISYTTPTGQFWHRYTGDGYGERPDGSQWEMDLPPGSRQTVGRLWPLLAGERGEYELAGGDLGSAERRLRDLARVSGTGDTMPEQVWDENAPSGQSGFPASTGTESATPLAWTHAQFIRLAWSVQEKEVVEQPTVVRCRYLGC